ncbi:MAG: 2-oxo acid dehydrogenase subunit E2 [Clostridia bacterium]|nr:2-oxo acid dehydrogenase subunit E2 [Clostridia bacterium]
MADRKRRWGDRKDGYRVRNLDSMHVIAPLIMPNRTDNEAVMTETIDITALNKYLEKKNYEGIDFKYTFFHVILAALAKTVVLRPRMNRFYVGPKLFDRKDIIFSFVVKKQFEDDAHEALALVKIEPDSDVSPIEQIYSKVKKFVCSVRRENKQDKTSDIMDALVTKLPSPILRFVFKVLHWLDYHGHYPSFLMTEDPYFSTAFISNLGSIKMKANYHHLANWGTNSFFVIVGEKHKKAFPTEDGGVEWKEVIDLGLTIDERIADGVYFAKSLKIFRELIANPELLEKNIKEDVETGDKK